MKKEVIEIIMAEMPEIFAGVYTSVFEIKKVWEPVSQAIEEAGYWWAASPDSILYEWNENDECEEDPVWHEMNCLVSYGILKIIIQGERYGFIFEPVVYLDYNPGAVAAEEARAALCSEEFKGMFWHHSLNAYSEKGIVPAEKLSGLQNFLKEMPEAELCVTEDWNALGSYGVGLQGELTALFSRDIWSLKNEDGTRSVSTSEYYEVLTKKEDLDNPLNGTYREGFLTHGKIQYLWCNQNANEWIQKRVHDLAKRNHVPYFLIDEYNEWMEERDSFFEDRFIPDVINMSRGIDLSEWY